ncbi:nucleotide exchange factor GrpE [Pseudaeromonas sp. ZJS20]|uniref:nucleotide exchange factor GrpE n=1 Tax=Pseudaeromonas aegiceratis TaxID=3153928 RepID=UPI00390C6B8D
MNNQEQAMDQQQPQPEQEQAAQAVPEVEFDMQALLEKLESAEAAAAEERDRAVRAVAEMENIRRRAAQDVEKAHKFALEKFVGELLPVIDNLERALEAGDQANEVLKPLLEGVELTLQAMQNSVAKFGVQAIDPQGKPFDPNQHQAMSLIENAEVAPNTVIAVMQKGYELNGRVVRPAMVMVAKAPSVDTQA